MNGVEIFMLAAGLAMDAGAVSLASAAAGYAADKRAVFRLSFHFGLFQFMMPVIGWYGGVHLVGLTHGFAHWAACLLLVFVGGKMVWSGIRPSGEPTEKDPSKGMTLVLLSLATSIDALAVGISLAMIGVGIWYPGAIIGVVTAGISIAAIGLGRRLGRLAGNRMEIMGGLILVFIGIKVVWGQ